MSRTREIAKGLAGIANACECSRVCDVCLDKFTAALRQREAEVRAEERERVAGASDNYELIGIAIDRK